MLEVERVAIVQHELRIMDTPESMNRPGQKNSWGFAAAKKAWQEQLVYSFHELNLPRPVPSLLFVDAVFYRPPKGGIALDGENARVLFSKACGDALTGKAGSTPGLEKGRRSERDKADRAFWLRSGARIRCGWLVDDGDEHWTLKTQRVTRRGPAETRVRLAWFDGPVSEVVGWCKLGLVRGEVTEEEVRSILCL